MVGNISQWTTNLSSSQNLQALRRRFQSSGEDYGDTIRPFFFVTLELIFIVLVTTSWEMMRLPTSVLAT